MAAAARDVNGKKKVVPVPERRGSNGGEPHNTPTDTNKASTSYVEAIKSKPVHHSPWLQNNGNFGKDVVILNADRVLPKLPINVVNDVLCLDETDYTPVEIGWGFCLLGFFAGRHPPKGDINKLAKSWPHVPKVSHHRNGWTVFRFEKESDMRAIMDIKAQRVAGSPLILCPLPKDFRFDTTPEVKYQVWVTLPNLPLSLWTPSALSKIASMLGEPVEVDPGTLARNNIEGPRCLIWFNALKQPVKKVDIRMHNGEFFTQHVRYDYYPLLCSTCMKIGHTADRCRAAVITDVRGTVNPPRTAAPGVRNETGWQDVQPRGKKGKQARAPSRQTRQPRSRSRKAGPNADGANPRVPKGPERPNTHKRFDDTPVGEQARTAAETKHGEEGTKSSTPGPVPVNTPTTPQAPKQMAVSAAAPSSEQEPVTTPQPTKQVATNGGGGEPSSSETTSSPEAPDGPSPHACLRKQVDAMTYALAKKSAKRGRSIKRSTKPGEPRDSSAGNTPRHKQVPLSKDDLVPIANKLNRAGTKRAQTKGKGIQTTRGKVEGTNGGAGASTKPLHGGNVQNKQRTDPVGDRPKTDVKQKEPSNEGEARPTKPPDDQ